MVRWFSRKRQPAPAEPQAEPAGVSVTAAGPQEHDADPEEHSPLADRLRTMDWPKPPEEVRERCLEQILARVGDPEDKAPADGPNGDEKPRRAAG